MTFKAKKVGKKYMLMDNSTNEFLIGFQFNSEVSAKKFGDSIKRKK